MSNRLALLGIVVLPALILIGAGMQIALSSSEPSGGGPAATATATPAPTPAPAAVASIESSLAAVQRAFNAGDLPKLCGRRGVVDPAVLGRQALQGPGCEAELEALIAHTPPLKLTVRQVSVRPDLATVAVTNARGEQVSVDMVRRNGRWLLSFSDGSDPMPVLAGTE